MRTSQSARFALSNSLRALLVLGACLVLAQTAVAEEKSTPAPEGAAAEPAKDGKDAKAPEKEEKIKTGIIANSGNYGFGPKTIDSADGGSAPGEEPSVISGGVSSIGNGKCQASLTNSSKENSYSVSYSVIGVNSRGAKVMNKSFSASLKPGETTKRELPCQDGLNMALELRSARKR